MMKLIKHIRKRKDKPDILRKKKRGKSSNK